MLGYESFVADPILWSNLLCEKGAHCSNFFPSNHNMGPSELHGFHALDTMTLQEKKILEWTIKKPTYDSSVNTIYYLASIIILVNRM